MYRHRYSYEGEALGRKGPDSLRGGKNIAVPLRVVGKQRQSPLTAFPCQIRGLNFVAQNPSRRPKLRPVPLSGRKALLSNMTVDDIFLNYRRSKTAD
jgi:hypothetical protein